VAPWCWIEEGLQQLNNSAIEFNKALFWDVQIASLDLETHARFIIERVVSRGSLPDWHLLKKIYGKERIKQEVLRIRALDRKTVGFLSVYCGVEKADFRCCS
jgi:hypothetical protein